MIKLYQLFSIYNLTRYDSIELTIITGLPVTLSRSGMGPFTAAFIFGFFMQV